MQIALLPRLPHGDRYPGKFVTPYGDRVGIVDESYRYRARGVIIRVKIVSRKPGYKTKGIAMWLNVVLTPGSST